MHLYPIFRDKRAIAEPNKSVQGASVVPLIRFHFPLLLTVTPTMQHHNFGVTKILTQFNKGENNVRRNG